MFNSNQITVSKTSIFGCRTISQALNKAKDGTKIIVQPGMYKESLTINTAVEIVGNSEDDPVVIQSNDDYAIRINNSNARLENLSIKHIGEGNAVYLGGSSIIANCTISSEAGNGVIIDGDSTKPTIENCEISTCNISGVYVSNGAFPKIIGCKLHHNSINAILADSAFISIVDSKVYSNASNGLHLINQSSGHINGSEIFNGSKSGVLVEGNSNLLIENCPIYSHEENNIWVHQDATITLKQSEIYDSRLSGILIETGAKATLEGCTVYDNKLHGINVMDKEVVVNESTLFKNGIAGIYFGNNSTGKVSNTDINNNSVNVLIESENNPSFQKCDIHNGENNGIHIIKKKTGTFENCAIHHNKKVNVLVEEYAKPLIRECTIHNSDEGGVTFLGDGVMEDCHVHTNKSHSICIDGGNPIIRSSKLYGFFRNDNFGEGKIQDCHISNEVGYGVVISKYSYPEFIQCKIIDCANSGVFIDKDGIGYFNECQISNNLNCNIEIIEGKNPLFRNCTIVNSPGFGVSLTKSTGAFFGCSISNNVKNNNVCEQSNLNLNEKTEKVTSASNGKDGRESKLKIVMYSNLGFSDIRFPVEQPDLVILLGGLDKKAIRRIDHYYTVPKLAITHYFEKEDKELFSETNIIDMNGKILHIEGVTFAGFGRNGSPMDVTQFQQLFSQIKKIDYFLGDCKIPSSNDGMLDNSFDMFILEKHSRVTNYDVKELLKEKQVKGYFHSKDEIDMFGTFSEHFSIEETDNIKVFYNIGMHELELEPSSSENSISKETTKHTPSASVTNPELQTILDEIDSLIGMEPLKQDIREMITLIEVNKLKASLGVGSPEQVMPAAPHTVLYGNPGTGKTTVAKLFGKLYKAMGLLEKGHVVQVNREKLVGEFIGHTAPKTKGKIDEAIGGVLFIDEAYELTNKGGSKDFGLEAIAVLLEEMENRRGEFMVIVAGYEKEMQQFLESNPGLDSRITKKEYLEDYTPEEMVEIAKKMIQEKNHCLSELGEKALFDEFTLLWRKRDRFFSNGRTVRNIVDKTIQKQSNRCSSIPRDQWTKELLETLNEQDVFAATKRVENKQFQVPINEELLSQALGELNRMIGLSNVKEEIEQLVTLVRYYKEENKNIQELALHTVLRGNPGTGKTEVSRIISNIYKALGVLERGSLIEVNRDKLIGTHVGESEKLITQYIDQAMGGTLFIDEAYQLTQYGAEDPGHKVIEILLKRMEDDRGKFLVLVAGYEREMEKFLDSNPGLRRRFANQLTFEDYTPSELMKITKLILSEKGYSLADGVEEELHDYYKECYSRRNHTFGNAGFVRNIVNKAIKNADFRIARIPKENRHENLLNEILLEDILVRA
ncbi:right-handed parallel beta-helix repeat-containing protein [Bacillus sp. m3-13]|uniref:right-handed parallel beta-helix repeat-containing protein n=1 Tax=Bacillus sp. m3-13 TaxID=406124 RepID=UPI0001E89D47|nr:right-handed parallel beta-helix repeat-containing protein [Bacillus sp. m3-13]